MTGNYSKKGNFCTVILLAQYLREILHISWQQNGTFVSFNEDSFGKCQVLNFTTSQS